jgi:tRNA dimethylallyltransferase
VVGPTASGKSALAMRLAEHHRGEILCVDSMTVYRGMDIGTAKPTAADRGRVVHHGLDLRSPAEAFSVAEFVRDADAVIHDARERDVPLICCGGTPMYFMALLVGLFEGPPADEALRAELSAWTPEALYAEVLRIDPPTAQRLHRNDTRRLVRAVEVFRLTGKTLTEHQTDWPGGVPKQFRYDATWVGLNWDKDLLNRRINARCKQMMSDGWLDEVRALMETYGDLGPTASEAAGYRFLIDHLRGRGSLDDAVEQTKIATRQLARNQLKWLRRWHWVKWVAGPKAGEVDVMSL